MKKVIILSLLCGVGSLVNAAAAGLDAATPGKFQAEAKYSALVAPIVLPADKENTRAVQSRQRVADIVELIYSKEPVYGPYALKGQINKLFKAGDLAAIAQITKDAGLNQIEAYTAPYRRWRESLRSAPAKPGVPAATLEEAAQKALEAVESVQKKLVGANPADLAKLKTSGLKGAVQALGAALP